MKLGFLQSWAPQLLSILRIITAATFLTHGTMKLLAWPAPFPYPLNGLTTTAAALEIIGGVLLVIGLFSRPVAFILSGLMAFAYFIAHAPQGFFPVLNGGEAAMLFCFVFLFIAAAGPGAWSMDAALGKDK
ncbi:DoxX family protein [Mesorhizobium sp. 1M-11]|uniref:DoxX family protein n=1 Tax=Mesorhizobium sp. 1M-11 TaxID=1529006 RepID=UPI0006C7672C|nr:DoxX family protein [Mesorhizobium sp. 1M-11]